jgi:hypothetical protein
VKNRITAGILEIRLFRDDLRTVFRAQLDILRHSLTYMRLSLVPMLWVILPMILLMIQLQFHYGYRPLDPGESVIVRATLADGFPADDAELSLSTDGALEVETPLLWLPEQKQASWRIRAREKGRHELRVRSGGRDLLKPLTVGRPAGPLSPRRSSSGLLDQLLYPVEPPIPDGGSLVSIEVAYRSATVGLLGWDVHWMVAFFILTLVFAFALQKPLRVTI